MWYKKHTTLLWVVVWGFIAIMANSTLTDAGSWAAIIAAFLAFVGMVFVLVRWLLRQCKLRKLSVSYWIPKSSYKHKGFKGAPDKPKFVKKLTVGIGTYNLLLGITTETDVYLNHIVLIFEGDEDGKPQHCGRDYGNLFDRLPDGSFRDWHGNVTIHGEYPSTLRSRQFLPDCYRIQTTTSWAGKLRIQIPIKERVIERCLDFTVEAEHDDVPFLKYQEDIPFQPSDSGLHQAGTTLP